MIHSPTARWVFYCTPSTVHLSFLVNRMTEIKDVLGELYPEIADFLAEQAYFNRLAMQEEYDHLLELAPVRK